MGEYHYNLARNMCYEEKKKRAKVAKVLTKKVADNPESGFTEPLLEVKKD